MIAPQFNSQRWMEKANDDLRWAKASLKEEVLHGVCFSSHFEQLVDQAATLSGYYVEARYPDIGDFMGYTREQSEEAYRFTQGIVAFVSEKLNSLRDRGENYPKNTTRPSVENFLFPLLSFINL